VEVGFRVLDQKVAGIMNCVDTRYGLDSMALRHWNMKALGGVYIGADHHRAGSNLIGVELEWD
jgi:hypothetical protein